MFFFSALRIYHIVILYIAITPLALSFLKSHCLFEADRCFKEG